MMTDVVPTFLRVDPGSLPMSPGLNRWQHRTRVALVAGLNPTSRHELTTAMQHLCRALADTVSPRLFPACQALVRFFASRRIKQHAPPLVRAPVNSFEF